MAKIFYAHMWHVILSSYFYWMFGTLMTITTGVKPRYYEETRKVWKVEMVIKYFVINENPTSIVCKNLSWNICAWSLFHYRIQFQSVDFFVLFISVVEFFYRQLQSFVIFSPCLIPRLCNNVVITLLINNATSTHKRTKMITMSAFVMIMMMITIILL